MIHLVVSSHVAESLCLQVKGHQPIKKVITFIKKNAVFFTKADTI